MVAKQGFVDNFSGSVLNERWREQSITGTPTFQMSDNINEGFEIITDTTSNGAGEIDFNDIQSFDNTSSYFIAESKRVTATNTYYEVGLGSSNLNTVQRYAFDEDSTASWKRFVTNQVSTTLVDSTVAPDTNWSTVKGEINNSMFRGWLDGDFVGVSTTNLPSVALQPAFYSRSRNTSASTNRIRYLEVFNL